MGAHVFVSPTVPGVVGIAVTAIMLMPLAALAAKIPNIWLTAGLTTIAQQLSHLSLQISDVTADRSSSPHGHHTAGVLSTHHAGSDISHSSHSSASMLIAHLCAAIVIAVLIAHVDGFLQGLADAFHRCVPHLASPVLADRTSLLVDTAVRCVLPCSEIRNAISRRGPPSP